MEFEKPPTWKDFTLVLAYLYDLERRIDDKDNHIYFAIGYCIDKGVELFGEHNTFEWIDEFSNLVVIRDVTLKLAGSTLVLLQNVENQITLFCSALQLKGFKLTFEDFLSTDVFKRKQTLGQLTKILKESEIFNVDFENKLTGFVEKRNQFTHSLWIEQGKKHKSESGLPSIKEYEEIHDFMRALIKEAHDVYDVFKGFYHLVDIQRAEKIKEEKPTRLQWERYIEEFKKALR